MSLQVSNAVSNAQNVDVMDQRHYWSYDVWLLACRAFKSVERYFKNDIDGYDCAVDWALLKAGYRPKAMQLEVRGATSHMQRGGRAPGVHLLQTLSCESGCGAREGA